VFSAKSLASVLLLSFFENIGINERFKAPSAKNDRNIFGREKAIKNASATGPEPKKIAINISRIKPKIRDRIVHAPTVKNDLNRLEVFLKLLLFQFP
jgi:hypothetical protein